MQEYTVKVEPQQENMRLDLFLTQFSNNNNLGFSRTSIQRLIREGRISLGSSEIRNPHYKVKTDEEIRLVIEKKEPGIVKAENIPLDIVYEDEDLAIINKPAGLVVHPAPGNYEHTLVNALLYHFKDLSDVNPERPGIVHRLDKETSGLLIVAKNNFAHLALSKQFAKHSIKRKYIAIVKGKMEFDENVVELPIGRHTLRRKKMAVGFGKTTKYAKTYYRTLKRREDFSVLELEPFTGRTHQLRVHLAFLGHPILGDDKYAGPKFKRLCLHAKSIGFIHPRSGNFIEFISPTPQELASFINKNKIS